MIVGRKEACYKPRFRSFIFKVWRGKRTFPQVSTFGYHQRRVKTENSDLSVGLTNHFCLHPMENTVCIPPIWLFFKMDMTTKESPWSALEKRPHEEFSERRKVKPNKIILVNRNLFVVPEPRHQFFQEA